LPVNLASFTANLINNNKVDLKWVTATEINLSHFVVERSTDGQNFNDVGLVFAFGNATTNNNYTLSDNISGIQAGLIYYRIRSIPTTNDVFTWDIITPALNISSTSFTVSFNYKISSPINGIATRTKIEIGLLDVAGNFTSLSAITLDKNTPVTVLTHIPAKDSSTVKFWNF
jgi:hypothetical protein